MHSCLSSLPHLNPPKHPLQTQHKPPTPICRANTTNLFAKSSPSKSTLGSDSMYRDSITLVTASDNVHPLEACWSNVRIRVCVCMCVGEVRGMRTRYFEVNASRER
jgi:hypothetical protein